MQGDNPDATALASWKTIKESTLYALQKVIIDVRVQSLCSSESACVMFDGWDGGDLLGEIIGITYNWIDDSTLRFSISFQLLGTTPVRARCIMFNLIFGRPSSPSDGHGARHEALGQ
jgi:hypothetical protein